MDIRQLQTMITLINSDFSVSRTAQKLFLVQSAVSQQLKRLEQELECELFVRKGKRLTGLTELGQQVLRERRAIPVSMPELIAERPRLARPGGTTRHRG